MTNYTHVRLEIVGRDAAILAFIEAHLERDGFFASIIPEPARSKDLAAWRLKRWGCMSDALSMKRSEFTGNSHTIFFLVDGEYPSRLFSVLDISYPRLEFWAAWWKEGDGDGGIGRAVNPVPILDEKRAHDQATGRAPLERLTACPCCGRA